MSQPNAAVEKAHLFGPDSGLLGIATIPATARPQSPAVILLNAGLVHRVGPFRAHVEIARRLAAKGFHVFRIDQSSLGDSAARRESMSYEDRSRADGADAMTFLEQRYGKTEFILIGLCAGALNAHRIAVADMRVVGACLLDGYAYRTRGSYARKLLTRALDPHAWHLVAAELHRAVTTKGEQIMSRRASVPPAPPIERPGQDAEAIFAQAWPPKAEMRRDLERVLSRGARMLFIYTGGWSGYTYETQFDDMFPALYGRHRVEVQYFREADHTYFMRSHREAMIGRIESFVTGFGG